MMTNHEKSIAQLMLPGLNALEAFERREGRKPNRIYVSPETYTALGVAIKSTIPAHVFHEYPFPIRQAPIGYEWFEDPALTGDQVRVE